jgi:hypothetical protein
MAHETVIPAYRIERHPASNCVALIYDEGRSVALLFREHKHAVIERRGQYFITAMDDDGVTPVMEFGFGFDTRAEAEDSLRALMGEPKYSVANVLQYVFGVACALAIGGLIGYYAGGGQ